MSVVKKWSSPDSQANPSAIYLGKQGLEQRCEVRVKKSFTEEQIAYALARDSTGQTIAEICRRLSVPEQTF